MKINETKKSMDGENIGWQKSMSHKNKCLAKINECQKNQLQTTKINQQKLMKHKIIVWQKLMTGEN